MHSTVDLSMRSSVQMGGINMSKRKPYALIALFLLSFGVVIGGWFLTEELLLQKQEEFLKRTGRIARQTGMPSALQPTEDSLVSWN